MVLESAHEDSLFGYDFSQGYTSLEKDEPPPPKPKKQNFLQRWLAQRAAKKHQQEQEQRVADDRRMDELLEKIQRFGKNSLTDEEQRFLKRVADRYKNKP
jgi:stage IV sporulation protein FB